jgi:sarcosine oxidase subunit gamma
MAESPLAYRATDLAAIGAVEAPIVAQVGLRVSEENAGDLPIPSEPNTVLLSGDRSTLWLGPDEWLVTSEDLQAAAIVMELEETLEVRHHAVVDLSANRAVVDLAGDDALDLLATGCSLDLHRRVWHAGMCAQTIFARAPVILEQRDRATRVFVRASFANYLIDRLLAARRAP